MYTIPTKQGTVPDHITKGYYRWSSASSSWERVGFPRSYGYFLSTANQTALSANTAYAVTYNSALLSSGVTINNNSQITFANKGLYNLQFSLQFNNSQNTAYVIGLWLRKNGVDVVNSATYLTIPARQTGTYPEAVAAWNFFAEVNTANDYYELVWFTSSTTVSVAAFSAITSPLNVPAVPSVILSVDQVK